MSKSRLAAARAKTGGISAVVNRDFQYSSYSDEELRMEAFKSRNSEKRSTQDAIANDNRRTTLMKQMGFDLFDIDELAPHPQNSYSLDQEDINNLAASILETGSTTPVLVRAKPDGGYEILGGERRWSAHKALTEQYGESWRMIPGRNLGMISDEDALFILHSDNLNQRVITPSERAKGFEIVADRLAKQRETDPDFKRRYKGKKTRAILAEQFHVSEATVATEIAISRHLPSSGKDLLDEGKLGKDQAAAISRLPEDSRQPVIQKIIESDLGSEEIDDLVSSIKRGEVETKDITAIQVSKTTKSAEDYLKSAHRALKKAYRAGGKVSYGTLGQIKELVSEIEHCNGDW